MQKIRFSKLPMGATFKYLNVLYVKIGNNLPKKNYNTNCRRLDNGKEMILHGSFLVELVK